MNQNNDRLAKPGLIWAVASLAAACSGDLQVEDPNAGAGGGTSTDGGGTAGNTSGATSSGGTSSGGASSSAGGSTTTTSATTTTTTGSGGSSGSGGTGSGGATCNDGLQNANETDVDCGGSECPPCGDGQSCGGDEDCDTLVCDDGICTSPDCFDGVRNGDETDVDCGGDDCNPCADGQECQSDDDCEWQHCNDGACQQEEEVCACDESDDLQLLRCGSDNVQVYSPDPFLVAHDGSVVIFQRCVPISPGMCMTMEVYRWEDGAGSELVASDVTAKALSQDGQTLLLQAGDMQALALVSPGGTQEIPLAGVGRNLSADGTTVIADLYPYGESEAQRWTLADGLQALPAVPDAGGRSYARDLSADGSVIVGYATTTSAVLPAIWSDDGAAVLDTLVNGALSARAFAVSADGSTVVGLTSQDTEASSATELLDIFRWTEADGMLAIAPALMSGPWGNGEQLAASADGSVVAGTLDLEAGSAYPGAFRWTESEGVTYLYPGGTGYQSLFASMDAAGDVILGMLGGTFSGTTFVWESESGAVELATRLEDRGVSIEGWTFEGAAQVSGDGRVVAGIGLCGGTPAVYRAVLGED